MNPNTQAQQHMRSCFTLMQELQKGLFPLLKKGFDRHLNAREHWVGVYHIALGHNMTEGAYYDTESARRRCNCAKFSIGE